MGNGTTGANMTKKFTISGKYSSENSLTMKCGNCLHFLKTLPDNAAQLVVTSPPYNIGKKYECRLPLDEYLGFQTEVIAECERILKPGGSICWQLGNHIDSRGRLLPLDIALFPVFGRHDNLHLRNRIVWHFEHGLHCRSRFSGRHETILWYTKGDDYFFNLDSVRVPQKYPGKLAYRGPKRGMPSGNPNGKNPGDVWQIPNVKCNHVEKTGHPCQFPIALAETLILALTNKRHLVVDPFMGAGTTAVAALKNGRRAAGVDLQSEYVQIARTRIAALQEDSLAYRPRSKPIYEPPRNSKLTTPPSGFTINAALHS